MWFISCTYYMHHVSPINSPAQPSHLLVCHTSLSEATPTTSLHTCLSYETLHMLTHHDLRSKLASPDSQLSRLCLSQVPDFMANRLQALLHLSLALVLTLISGLECLWNHGQSFFVLVLGTSRRRVAS